MSLSGNIYEIFESLKNQAVGYSFTAKIGETKDEDVVEYTNSPQIIPNKDVSVGRMRLDYECDARHSWDRHFAEMAMQTYADLSELLEYGDVHARDPLLNVFDGRRKRGRGVIDARLMSTQLFREYKPRKQTYEYTMYTLFRVDWEKASSSD